MANGAIIDGRFLTEQDEDYEDDHEKAYPCTFANLDFNAILLTEFAILESFKVFIENPNLNRNKLNNYLKNYKVLLNKDMKNKVAHLLIKEIFRNRESFDSSLEMFDLIKEILNVEDVDINQKNENGMTYLDLFLQNISLFDVSQIEIFIDLLLKKGFDFLEVANAEDLLFIFLEQGLLEPVDWLERRGGSSQNLDDLLNLCSDLLKDKQKQIMQIVAKLLLETNIASKLVQIPRWSDRNAEPLMLLEVLSEFEDCVEKENLICLIIEKFVNANFNTLSSDHGTLKKFLTSYSKAYLKSKQIKFSENSQFLDLFIINILPKLMNLYLFSEKETSISDIKKFNTFLNAA